MTPAVHDPRTIQAKSLLSVGDLSSNATRRLLDQANGFAADMDAGKAFRDDLRGKFVLNMFFENSTRTRTSFELGAKLLSAEVVNFNEQISSVQKGESLRDTIETATMMGFDAFVIRHATSGAPEEIRQWTNTAIINAGDGVNQHPTQALLDALTYKQYLGTDDFTGKRLGIVGDIAHSRVSRSVSQLFGMLGATITLVGPASLMPDDVTPWNAHATDDLDEVIGDLDAVYTIRPQQERVTEGLIPSMPEYVSSYRIDTDRFARMNNDAVILEAGPLVRGVQMTDDVAANERNLMNRQVRNGVALRMAVLHSVLIGGESW